MSARPLIGLTTSHLADDAPRTHNGLSRRYSQAVERVGGLPILLPNQPDLAADYAGRLDAVLFSGGVDVHPRHFGQHPRRGMGEVDEARDAFETALYRAARALGKPVLGICRGFQMINVLEGGTLHQHLPDVPGAWVDHAQRVHADTLGHEVSFTPDSLLAQTHGERALVNSSHHQAVDEVAPTLRVTAVAPDGIVEAVEAEGVIGVQWHPEVLFGAHPHALGTFTAFMRLLA